MAGYSWTPLPRKLGIKPGHRVAFPGAPDGFLATLGELPLDVSVVDGEGGGAVDVVVFFTTDQDALRAAFPRYGPAVAPAGALWIAWPKRASRVPTTVTEGRAREIGLAAGMVDVKVCAIDDTWSGLKFVYRLKDRAALGE
ncbi:MAG TPA: hypothetical protein VFH27_12855 [Longimicrobiaceae bacterium]|nr:hypothetical protein [Longimicrobiaceae bacterium]